jgi:hypothetical protein
VQKLKWKNTAGAAHGKDFRIYALNRPRPDEIRQLREELRRLKRVAVSFPVGCSLAATGLLESRHPNTEIVVLGTIVGAGPVRRLQ